METRKIRGAEIPLTIENAAMIAGVSRGTLYSAIRRGELQCVVAGGRRGRRILPADLKAFLQPRPVIVARATDDGSK